MLEWLTFVAAVLAAAGAIIGPIVAYRSATNAMSRQEAQATLNRRQTQIDLATRYAISEDLVIAEMGIKQLQYMLDVGELASEQRVAVVSAIAASLRKAAQELDSEVDARAVEEGPLTTPPEA